MAVSEMDKVTQQNAASAEESSSAASELSGQAEELASMVAAFQLTTQAHTNAAVAPRRSLTLPAASPSPRALARSPQNRAPRGVRHDDAPSPAPRRQTSSPSRADEAFPMDDASEVKDF
jgi:methyl-accepting chemotaxis protein